MGLTAYNRMRREDEALKVEADKQEPKEQTKSKEETKKDTKKKQG